MKNSRQAGKVMTVVSAAEIVSGKLYQVGVFIGVATGSVATADIGAEYELALNGAVKIPNTDSLAAAQGVAVGYDQANHKIVAQGAGDFDVELFAPMASGDEDAVILLPKGGF